MNDDEQRAPGAGIVVVGSGIAGATAAQTLRAEGFTGPVTLVGAEARLPYRRTALSKDLLAADLSPGRITLKPAEFWAERDIEVIGGAAVRDIDAAGASILLDDGTVLGYRALILATGARPIRPSWLDDDVFALRTVADAERIRSAITDSGSLVVIGGGLIGLELAASAAGAGLAVTVLESADRVMNRVVPAEVSEYLAQLHRSHGVDLRLGARVVGASSNRVECLDGTVVEGTVVAAVGAAPNVTLAEAAGASIGSGGGIVVDGALRTTVERIYAAGDAAAVPDPVSGDPMRGEHWFGALDQGAAVAHSVLADLVGEPAPVFAEVPRAWTVQYGVNMQMVGRPDLDGEVAVDGDPVNEATVTVTRDGRLLGAVTLGRAAAARALRARIADNAGAPV